MDVEQFRPTKYQRDAHAYVRIRLPDQFIQQNSGNPKTLTLDVIKFGITRNLNEIHDEIDNGYAVFSFHFKTQAEAEIIEGILKVDFGRITVEGNDNYLDTNKLAEIFEMNYDHSYESYFQLAECFFLDMVRLVCKIWPDHYETEGSVYDICESVPKYVPQLKPTVQIVPHLSEAKLVFRKRTFRF